MKTVEQLAREAGYKHPDAVGECENFAFFDLEHFAALHREAVVQELVAGSGEPEYSYDHGEYVYHRDQLAGAVAAERERCAQVLDDLYAEDETVSVGECAAAIRGQT